jgi:hypothetical protein
MADVSLLKWVVLASALSGAAACISVEEMAVNGVGRADRIVVGSPHFDEAPAVSAPFNCPANALHLIGYESAQSGARAPLTIRTLIHPHNVPWSGIASPMLAEVSVRFAARMEGSVGDTLPLQEPWLALTDSTGRAVFDIPSGVYRVRFEALGFRGGAAIVRVRNSAGDSLRAFLDARPVC